MHKPDAATQYGSFSIFERRIMITVENANIEINDPKNQKCELNKTTADVKFDNLELTSKNLNTKFC